jgi:hypothetical protein
MIEEMSSDNQFLRNTIGELEEQVCDRPLTFTLDKELTLCRCQIAKLSNSLVGNKSHFAKYVEVKSENIMLQVRPSNISFSASSLTLVSSTVKIGKPRR